MRVNILCNEVFDGWEPTDARLGGTEEGIFRWAKELGSRGHEVHVYRNGRGDFKLTEAQCGLYGVNVWYSEREDYKGGGDICLNHKSPEIEPFEPTLYITTETNASMLDLSKYDGVVWPSNWAKDNIPVNNDNVFVVPYGYDPKQIYPGKKITKQCFYASSPDRGLDTLLEAWPKVYEAHPDATLLVTYGAEPRDLPGVTFLGDVDEETMNDIYRTSDIWCHPCNGGELYCITGIKAQVAQCIPVYNSIMALRETVKHGYSLYGDEAKKQCLERGERWSDWYAGLLIYALDNKSIGGYETNCVGNCDIRKRLGQEHYPTWSDSVDSLMKTIESVVK